MKKLVIAEKPSVGKEIAKVLQVNTLNREYGYFENNDYIVFWAFGHLIGLSDPEVYGCKEWKIDNLPILPNPFIYTVIDDPGVKKQYKILKDLFHSPQISSIVCATDSGREGEAIFRYIYNQTGTNKPIERLWISSLTEKSIRKGFEELKSGKEFDNLYLSAKARNEADWLIGINSTRALTLITQSKKVLSIGRVQTPTLALICERYIEHINFKSSTYFTVQIIINDNLKVKCNIKFNTKEEVENYLNKIHSLTVTEISKNIVKENPPLPFDLTSLQMAANNKFGFKAQKTLDIAQKLYEGKLLTYPRTSSRYLGEDMEEQAKDTLNNLKSHQIIMHAPDTINPNCFNNAKLSDHHAIIPTGEFLNAIQSLSKDESMIFDLVRAQFVTSLYPICVKEKIQFNLSFDREEDYLTLTGINYIEKGWRDTYEQEEDEDPEEQVVPLFKEGQKVDILEKSVKENKTKPAAIHTEASLLHLMETAGHDSEDPEIRQLLKENGIGTPATRAGIIEILFKRNFITNQGKKLVPTDLGMFIYNLVKELPVANISLTGDMEKSLNLISKGSLSVDKFMQELLQVNDLLLKQILSITQKVSNYKETAFKCLACNGPIVETDSQFKCKECKFALWKKISGHSLTVKEINSFFGTGNTESIKFTNKEGKPFEAILSFDKEFDNFLKFQFPERQELETKCPVCSDSLIRTTSNIYCKNKECKFSIPLQICKKNLSSNDLKLLLDGKATTLINGFISSSKKKFNASLYWDKTENKLKFKFS